MISCDKCEKVFEKDTRASEEQALRMHRVRVHTRAGRRGAKMGAKLGAKTRRKKQVDTLALTQKVIEAEKVEQPIYGCRHCPECGAYLEPYNHAKKHIETNLIG